MSLLMGYGININMIKTVQNLLILLPEFLKYFSINVSRIIENLNVKNVRTLHMVYLIWTPPRYSCPSPFSLDLHSWASTTKLRNCLRFKHKSLPTHFQVQDNYHTLQSFPQHLGATQVEVCVLLVLNSHLKPAFRR